MASGEQKNRKILYALVWWNESRQKSIIPASKIPKNCKYPNSETELWWVENGKKNKFKAKILSLNCK